MQPNNDEVVVMANRLTVAISALTEHHQPQQATDGASQAMGDEPKTWQSKADKWKRDSDRSKQQQAALAIDEKCERVRTRFQLLSVALLKRAPAIAQKWKRVRTRFQLLGVALLQRMIKDRVNCRTQTILEVVREKIIASYTTAQMDEEYCVSELRDQLVEIIRACPGVMQKDDLQRDEPIFMQRFERWEDYQAWARDLVGGGSKSGWYIIQSYPSQEFIDRQPTRERIVSYVGCMLIRNGFYTSPSCQAIGLVASVCKRHVYEQLCRCVAGTLEYVAVSTSSAAANIWYLDMDLHRYKMKHFNIVPSNLTSAQERAWAARVATQGGKLIHLPANDLDRCRGYKIDAPRICQWCGKGVERNLKCSKCVSAIYCSKKCQLEAWSSHSKYCSAR